MNNHYLLMGWERVAVVVVFVVVSFFRKPTNRKKELRIGHGGEENPCFLDYLCGADND